MNNTTSEFTDKYTTIKNHLVEDAPHNDCMYETSGEELKHVQEKENIKKVWTVVEGDDGELYIVTGYHLVNRLGYILTENEWTDEEEYYIF